MKKFCTTFAVFLIFASYIQAQNEEPNSIKQHYFGVRAGGRICIINVSNSTVWSDPRIGFSAGVLYRYFIKNSIFLSAGYEFYQNSFYDNINEVYLQESNNSLFLDLNICNRPLSNKFSPFLGVGTAIDFSNYRNITTSRGFRFSSDPTLKKEDYFIPLNLTLGIQKVKEKKLSEVSMSASRNIYASNKNGNINTNTLILKIQYSYLF